LDGSRRYLTRRAKILITPSFKGFHPSSSRATHTLSRIRAIDTKCERELCSVLWRRGLRFRKNIKHLPGKPDVVFISKRLAIFCDGDFWHGKNWSSRRRKLSTGSNSSYWVAKIQANISRDRRCTIKLRKLGWEVLRVWESEILAKPHQVANRIQKILRSRS
jgi:DNA mismatch endonuclease (patch repair protein)